METLQLVFDYQQLDTEIQTIVQQEDKEFDQNIARGNGCYTLAGRNLSRIQEILRYKHPGFVDYLRAKRIPHSTAYKLINIGKMFPESGNISSVEALALLAAPSTPDEARQEAIERAQNGETITHSAAKEIVNNYKQEFDFDAIWFPASQDEHLDAALEDESKPVCRECGQVYDGASCPDCHPQNGNRMSQSMEILLSHKSVEYYTPIEIIEAARMVLGQIDLDPASCNEAQQTVRATRFYTADMDGLVQEWLGRVWLNPPYSKTNGQSNQELWAKKLLQEYRNGNVTAAVLLVKSALGYKWFEQLWDELPACFARQRMSFTKSDGTNDGESKHGTTLFYLGNDLPRFIDIFSRIGRITTPDGRYFNGNKFSLPESTE